MRRLNNSNELKIGAFLSYVQTGAQILVALLYTPVMLRILGQNEYGLYNTISSTISMLSVLSLGFSNAYIRFYARYKVNEEKEKIERLNGLFLLVYFIIGIIAFLCGLYLSFNLKLVFDEGLTAEELEKAKIMMILLALNLGISFPMSTFTSYINAHERFSFIYAINIVKIVCSPFVQIPLLLMGFGAVGMTAVIFAFNMFVNLAEVIYSIKKLNFRMKLGKGAFQKPVPVLKPYRDQCDRRSGQQQLGQRPARALLRHGGGGGVFHRRDLLRLLHDFFHFDLHRFYPAHP